MDTDIDEAIHIITNGGVGVLPTDTQYGLVGSALSVDAVERIYELKRRDTTKPLIVLIADIASLEQFGVVVTEELEERLRTYWPGPYSVILPVIDEQFDYIHEGIDAIAFRYPDDQVLLDIITATGPLVAPSANMEGQPPAKTTEEARRYFGTDVDFYVDGDELNGKSSTILRFNGDGVDIIRE